MKNVYFLMGTSVFLAFCAANVNAADPPKQAAAAVSNPAVAAADGTFMTKAAGGGIYEVEVSKLAAEKASSADVKKYAAMLVEHHTAANNELKALAAAKNVDLPSEMPADKKAKMADLAKMSGESFDKAYVQKVGIDDHETDIKLFEKAAKGATDTSVKGFAAKTLPVLKQHLAGAKGLAKGRTSAHAGAHPMT